MRRLDGLEDDLFSFWSSAVFSWTMTMLVLVLALFMEGRKKWMCDAHDAM